MSTIYSFTMPDEFIDTVNFPQDTFLSKESMIKMRKSKQMTLTEASKYKHVDMTRQIRLIILNRSNRRLTKDGFEPGFQDNLGENVSSRGEYDKRLKELGLIEVGKDTECFKESTTTGGYCNTIEFALEARKIGVDLSDNEIEAIASGEYFDSSKCDLSAGDV